jgi:hypothetical protein
MKIKTLFEFKLHWITDGEIADYLWLHRATIHQYRHGKYPATWWTTQKILQFVDLDKMLWDIKYKQLIDKIKETEKYCPDWLDIYLYNDKTNETVKPK